MSMTAQENIRNMGVANGKPAVLVNVTQQPGANVIEVVDRIKAMLPELQKRCCPPSINLVVIQDHHRLDPQFGARRGETLVLSTILVVLVVFFFLRNLRATLVPAVSVPLSLLGTFGGMYLLGFSLDNFSLMALIVSTGFVVDNTIVVLENVTRHLEMGEDRLRSGAQGAQEVAFTVLSMSISLVAVFLPILLLGGIVGQDFPRIRRDPDHRHRHVAGRFAHRDADDVRLSRPSAPRRTRTACCLVAAHLRGAAWISIAAPWAGRWTIPRP